MASWTVPPCLVVLRDEFNSVNPKRDKGADGTIGDQAHSERTSDHNIDDGPDQGSTPYEDSDSKPEVHALDVDSTGPWLDGKGGEPGGWFDRTIHAIVAQEKREYEHPTIKGRLQNVIWRGLVCSRSWGWSEWRPADGHYDHAHFSARYDSETEADTRPWGVKEDEVNDEDIKKIAAAVWAEKLEDPTEPGRMVAAGTFLRYTEAKRDQIVGEIGKAKDEILKAISGVVSLVKGK
jgi:hypothetical protein